MKANHWKQRTAINILILAAVLGALGCKTLSWRGSGDVPRKRRMITTGIASQSGPAIGIGGNGSGATGTWVRYWDEDGLEISDLPDVTGRMGQDAGLAPNPNGGIGEMDLGGMGPAGGGTGVLPGETSLFNPGASDDPRHRTGQVDGSFRGSVNFETIYFDFDSSDIRDDQWDILRRNAGILMDNPDLVIVVEGHSDERGTEEYNFALSDRRAESVRKALIGIGVDPEQLSAVPFGESKPVDPRETEEAWRKNRRVEFSLPSESFVVE